MNFCLFKHLGICNKQTEKAKYIVHCPVKNQSCGQFIKQYQKCKSHNKHLLAFTCIAVACIKPRGNKIYHCHCYGQNIYCSKYAIGLRKVFDKAECYSLQCFKMLQILICCYKKGYLQQQTQYRYHCFQWTVSVLAIECFQVIIPFLSFVATFYFVNQRLHFAFYGIGLFLCLFYVNKNRQQKQRYKKAKQYYSPTVISRKVITKQKQLLDYKYKR